MENKSLSQIEDPKTRLKLAGMQEIAIDVSKAILDCKRAIDEKRGVVTAAKIIADRVLAEHSTIDKELQEGNLDPEIAKAKKGTITHIANVITEIGLRNQNDMTMLEGKLAGLEQAVNMTEQRFNNLVAQEARKKELESDLEPLKQELPAKPKRKKTARKKRKG